MSRRDARCPRSRKDAVIKYQPLINSSFHYCSSYNSVQHCHQALVGDDLTSHRPQRDKQASIHLKNASLNGFRKPESSMKPFSHSLIWSVYLCSIICCHADFEKKKERKKSWQSEAEFHRSRWHKGESHRQKRPHLCQFEEQLADPCGPIR